MAYRIGDYKYASWCTWVWNLAFVCWRTNTGWRYSRMGWWGRYFDL